MCMYIHTNEFNNQVGAADECLIPWFLSCSKPACVISYFGMLHSSLFTVGRVHGRLAQW